MEREGGKGYIHVKNVSVHEEIRKEGNTEYDRMREVGMAMKETKERREED